MPFEGITQLKYVGEGGKYTPVGLRQAEGGVILSVCPFKCVPLGLAAPLLTGYVHGGLKWVLLTDAILV